MRHGRQIFFLLFTALVSLCASACKSKDFFENELRDITYREALEELGKAGSRTELPSRAAEPDAKARPLLGAPQWTLENDILPSSHLERSVPPATASSWQPVPLSGAVELGRPIPIEP